MFAAPQRLRARLRVLRAGATARPAGAEAPQLPGVPHRRGQGAALLQHVAAGRRPRGGPRRLAHPPRESQPHVQLRGHVRHVLLPRRPRRAPRVCVRRVACPWSHATRPTGLAGVRTRSRPVPPRTVRIGCAVPRARCLWTRSYPCCVRTRSCPHPPRRRRRLRADGREVAPGPTANNSGTIPLPGSQHTWLSKRFFDDVFSIDARTAATTNAAADAGTCSRPTRRWRPRA